MNILVILSAISNLIIALSTTAFIVFVYGRHSLLDKLPSYEILTLKAGLSMLAAGALFNFLTFPTPTLYEFMLDAGLAFIMGWAAIFHYKFFVKKK